MNGIETEEHKKRPGWLAPAFCLGDPALYLSVSRRGQKQGKLGLGVTQTNNTVILWGRQKTNRYYYRLYLDDRWSMVDFRDRSRAS